MRGQPLAMMLPSPDLALLNFPSDIILWQISYSVTENHCYHYEMRSIVCWAINITECQLIQQLVDATVQMLFAMMMTKHWVVHSRMQASDQDWRTAVRSIRTWAILGRIW
jgi:hypothetical protein